MRAALRGIWFDPQPATLPADPASFAFLTRLIVGPSDADGEESFDVTVASPDWLAARCREAGGILDGRHHLIVDPGTFDQAKLRDWLTQRVQAAQADSWPDLAAILARLGHWEFEDYPE
jgi:hypothetical protein